MAWNLVNNIQGPPGEAGTDLVLDADGFYVPVGAGGVTRNFGLTDLDDGILTVPRELGGDQIHDWDGLSSGTVMMMYLYPTRDRTITHLFVQTGESGGAPTLAKVGVYGIDGGTGNATLLASTADTPALVTSAWTSHDLALDVSVEIVAGQTYAFGVLIVTSNAMPTLRGRAYFWDDTDAAPRLLGRYFGQTDMPSTMNGVNIYDSAAAIYIRGH